MKKIALLLMVVASSSMTAQSQPNPSVEVTGEGIVNVVPDQVTVNVRVENTGSNPKELKQQNDRTVAEVLQFEKGMGIDSIRVAFSPNHTADNLLATAPFDANP